MAQRTVGQSDTHRTEVNHGNIAPAGGRTGGRTVSRKDGFTKALPGVSLLSPPLTMPQLTGAQLGDRAPKPLTYNSSFGLPGYIDRRQSAAAVGSSGSDLLDSFYSNGARKKVQALFKATPRANISLPCGDLPQANAAKPSASNAAPSADAQVRGVAEINSVKNKIMDNKAAKTKASKTVGEHKTSRDSAVERLSSIVKGDRLSIERGRHQP